MEDIRKLIEIKRQKGHRSIQLLNQNFRKSEISKDNLLYDLIIEHDLKTDDEAAQFVFNTDANNRNYRNVKSKLRLKLLNNLYFLDYEKKGYTHYQRYEYESFHVLHQAKILMNEGAIDLVTKKLLHLLKFSKVCELIDIVNQTLIWLKEIYAHQGKLSMYNEVVLALGYYLQYQIAIRESEALYFDELVQINKSFSAQIRALGQIPSSIKQIKRKAARFNSERIELLAFKLELLYFRITNDFKKLVSLCTEIEEGFLLRKDGEIRVDIDKNTIFLTKIDAYFNLHKYKDGLDFAFEKKEFFKLGSQQWFQFFELRFQLAMYGKQFKKAAEYFRDAKTHKHFNDLPEGDVERWNIYRGYLVYFNKDKLVRWGFNVNHFLKYKLNYPKEYIGYNIAILAIRFMYFLSDGDLKGINITLNKIAKFNSSHLDKRSNYRNSIFIRLINLVIENEFNHELVNSKSENYVYKLKTTHIPQDKYADLEVYPYELMWKEVLRILKTNKHYVHFKFYHFTK